MEMITFMSENNQEGIHLALLFNYSYCRLYITGVPLQIYTFYTKCDGVTIATVYGVISDKRASHLKAEK